MGENLDLVTPPAAEPVSLDEAKLWFKQDIDDDDAIVAGLITAARLQAEKELRQSFITTTWKLRIDGGFPSGGGYFNRAIRQLGEGPLWLPQQGGGVFVLPRPPLIGVDSITFVDASGSPQTVDPSTYRFQAGSPGKVQPIFGQVWPIAAPVIDAVQITFRAGYGDSGNDGQGRPIVPANIQLGIKMLALYYYQNRMDGGDIPAAILGVLSAADHGSYA